MAGSRFRIGVDLGGTKIALTLLDETDREIVAKRSPTPREDYEATMAAIADLVAAAEAEAGCSGKSSIGIAMPGSISPATGRVQNANSTWLNGKPFDADLQRVLGRPLRFANDANCFALSEAMDGAARGARSVFGVILGTGCGGGLVHDGRLINGPLGIGGEWGHIPLPWPDAGDLPAPQCWCGLHGCMESWVSGPALYRDYLAGGGDTAHATSAVDLTERAKAGDEQAAAAFDRHARRLARGLAVVVNIFDPDIIVLGGGLSRLGHLYDRLGPLAAPYIFSDRPRICIRPPRHGDASGVRGAARLWDPE